MGFERFQSFEPISPYEHYETSERKTRLLLAAATIYVNSNFPDYGYAVDVALRLEQELDKALYLKKRGLKIEETKTSYGQFPMDHIEEGST